MWGCVKVGITAIERSLGKSGLQLNARKKTMVQIKPHRSVSPAETLEEVS